MCIRDRLHLLHLLHLLLRLLLLLPHVPLVNQQQHRLCHLATTLMTSWQRSCHQSHFHLCSQLILLWLHLLQCLLLHLPLHLLNRWPCRLLRHALVLVQVPLILHLFPLRPLLYLSPHFRLPWEAAMPPLASWQTCHLKSCSPFRLSLIHI